MGAAWADASLLGVLMNTRGLIELVVLNIGLDLGILSPVLFSMMVVMARDDDPGDLADRVEVEERYARLSQSSSYTGSGLAAFRGRACRKQDSSKPTRPSA